MKKDGYQAAKQLARALLREDYYTTGGLTHTLMDNGFRRGVAVSAIWMLEGRGEIYINDQWGIEVVALKDAEEG